MATPGENSMRRTGRAKGKPSCSACKQRRLKCDETVPTCQRCESSGRICEGLSGKTSTSPQTLALSNASRAANATTITSTPMVVVNQSERSNNKLEQMTSEDELVEGASISRRLSVVARKRAANTAPLQEAKTLRSTKRARKNKEEHVDVDADRRSEQSQDRILSDLRLQLNCTSIDGSQQTRTTGVSTCTDQQPSTSTVLANVVEDERQSPVGLRAVELEEGQRQIQNSTIDTPSESQTFGISSTRRNGQSPMVESSFRSVTQTPNSPDSPQAPRHRRNQTSVQDTHAGGQSPEPERIGSADIARDGHQALQSCQRSEPGGASRTSRSLGDDSIPQQERPEGRWQPVEQNSNARHLIQKQNTGEPPAVAFTMDNCIQTALSTATVGSLVEIFSRNAQVLLGLKGTPAGDIMYPVDVIMWQQLTDFYRWYMAETTTAKVSTFTFQLLDVDWKLKKTAYVPVGNLYSFQLLKQCIWDSFWVASGLNHPPAQLIILVRSGIPVDVFPHQYQPRNSPQQALTIPPHDPEISMRLQTDAAGKVSDAYSSECVLRPGITASDFFAWFASQTGRGAAKGPPSLRFTFKDAMPCPTSSTIAQVNGDHFNLMKRELRTEFEKAKEYMPSLKDFVVLVTDPGWVTEEEQ